MNHFTQPQRLRPKDKIAVLSPSSGMPSLFPWVYDQDLKRVRDVCSLNLIEFSSARKSSEFLSKHPKARAEDINAAFADSSIKAIIATIGGNDQIRVLPYLDKDLTADLLDGAVLFVETSEEMPSSGFVYRFIATLAEVGFLKKFKAILVGYPKAQFCGMSPPEGREACITGQQTVIKAALKDYGISLPVIFNLNFGHTDPQIIFPSGGCVKIDGVNRMIEFIA